MYAVNELIQDAYSGVNMTGLGESTDGDMAVVGKKELNGLISTLNSQGYISLSQKYVDAPMARTIYIKELESGETADSNVIDMEPPQSVYGVSRQVGLHWVSLHPIDPQQMYRSNRIGLPYSWNYSRDFETVTVDDEEVTREVGKVELDGQGSFQVRIFYNAPLPKYELDDTIYLPDLYNELLLSGLMLRLAEYYELSDSKKASCETRFKAASTLIKRNAITQRMMREEPVGTSYRDQFANGFCPTQWG